MVKVYFEKLRLFLIFIFLFGQITQLMYPVFTFTLLLLIFISSFLTQPLNDFSLIDFLFLLYISIITISFNFYDNKLTVLHYYLLYIPLIPLIYFSFKKIEKDTIFPIISFILSLATLIVIIGLCEVFFKKNIIYEFWINNPYYFRFIHSNRRMMSTLIHPTVFGSFLVGVIHFSYFIFSAVKKIYKPLIFFIIILLLSAIIFSFSRGNLFALILSSIIYFYLQKKSQYIKFIILGLIIFFFLSSYYLKNKFSFNRFSFNSLISCWWETELDNLNIVKKILKQHPLIGIGMGNYRIKFEDYITDKRKKIEIFIKKQGYDPWEWRTPDNMYLCMLAENGLLGFGSFIIFLFLFIKKALSKIKVIQDQIIKNFLVACLCGVIGLLVSMTTYDLFYWLNPALLFWFLIAHLRT